MLIKKIASTDAPFLDEECLDDALSVISSSPNGWVFYLMNPEMDIHPIVDVLKGLGGLDDFKFFTSKAYDKSWQVCEIQSSGQIPFKVPPFSFFAIHPVSGFILCQKAEFISSKFRDNPAAKQFAEAIHRQLQDIYKEQARVED